MRRRRKIKRSGMAALATAALLAGPVAAACSSGPTYDQWAATDGAAGRINLDEVQEAFKKSESATEFEKRVNEIYEGDGIVLIRAKQDGELLTLEGWEDLNKSKEIDDQDDLLFEIVQDTDKQNTMRGRGSNGYYNNSFGAGNFLMTYMLISALSPRGGYLYSTPINRYDTMSRNRTNYRSSSTYRSQVTKNSNYFSRQKSFAGSSYTNASKSASRNTYLNSQKSSGAFKSSSTGVRSSWGSSSGSSRTSASSGGFRGGGGSTRVIGFVRPSLR